MMLQQEERTSHHRRPHDGAPSMEDDGWTRSSNHAVMQTLMEQMDNMQRAQDLREKETQALKQQVTRELLKKQQELFVLQAKLEQQEERIQNLLKLVDAKQKKACPQCGCKMGGPPPNVITTTGDTCSTSTSSTDVIGNAGAPPHQPSRGEVNVHELHDLWENLAAKEKKPVKKPPLRMRQSVGEMQAVLPQGASSSVGTTTTSVLQPPKTRSSSEETPIMSNKTAVGTDTEDQVADLPVSVPGISTPRRTTTPFPTKVGPKDAPTSITAAGVVDTIKEEEEEEEEEDSVEPQENGDGKPPSVNKPRRTFTPFPTKENENSNAAASAAAVPAIMEEVVEEEEGDSVQPLQDGDGKPPSVVKPRRTFTPLPTKLESSNAAPSVNAVPAIIEEEEEEGDSVQPLQDGDGKPPSVNKPRRTFTPLPTKEKDSSNAAPSATVVPAIMEEMEEEEEDDVPLPPKNDKQVNLHITDKKVEAERVPSTVTEEEEPPVEEKEPVVEEEEPPAEEEEEPVVVPPVEETVPDGDRKPAAKPTQRRKKTPYPVHVPPSDDAKEKDVGQDEMIPASIEKGNVDKKDSKEPKPARRRRKKTPYPVPAQSPSDKEKDALEDVMPDKEKDVLEDVMNDAHAALKPLEVKKLSAVPEVESIDDEDADVKPAAEVKPATTTPIPTATFVPDDVPTADVRRSIKKGIQPSNEDELLVRGQSLTVPPTNIELAAMTTQELTTQITLDSALEEPSSSITHSFNNTERLLIKNVNDDFSVASHTVATSTYHEDRQSLVNQTMLDPHGESGKYTGVVLASTGMPHGLGRMVYDEDGRVYEGDWRHGMWHGFGKAMFFNGDAYEGEYRFDQRHGRGFYQWKDGRQYDGEFSYDKRHGRGTFKWPDGSSYEGDFVQGQREGQGRYMFKDGGCYEGGWVDGFYDGYGECNWADGRFYKGEWKQGRAHGRGVEAYANGTIRHDGMWKDDEPLVGGE